MRDPADEGAKPRVTYKAAADQSMSAAAFGRLLDLLRHWAMPSENTEQVQTLTDTEDVKQKKSPP